MKQIVANELEVREKTEVRVTFLVVCIEVKPLLRVDSLIRLVSKPEGHFGNNRGKLWLKIIRNLKTQQTTGNTFLSLAFRISYLSTLVIFFVFFSLKSGEFGSPPTKDQQCLPFPFSDNYVLWHDVIGTQQSCVQPNIWCNEETKKDLSWRIIAN